MRLNLKSAYDRVDAASKWAGAELRGMLKLRPVLSDPDLRIVAARGKTPETVIVFNSLHQKFAGDSPAEFLRTATADGQRNAIFISDLSRSWFQGRTVADRIVSHVGRYLEDAGLTAHLALGYSMGGYGAAVFASKLKVKTALAIGPQWDASMDTPERCWKAERGAIREFNLGPAGGHIDGAIRIYTVHGIADQWHAEFFAAAPGVLTWVKPRCPHNMTGRLKKAGVLVPMVEAAFDRDDARFAGLMRDFKAPQLIPGAAGASS